MTHLISDVDISPRSVADDGVSAVRCPIWRGELIAIGRCVSLQGERAECAGCPHARKAKDALAEVLAPPLPKQTERSVACHVCGKRFVRRGNSPAKLCSTQCALTRRRILQRESMRKARAP